MRLWTLNCQGYYPFHQQVVQDIQPAYYPARMKFGDWVVQNDQFIPRFYFPRWSDVHVERNNEPQIITDDETWRNETKQTTLVFNTDFLLDYWWQTCLTVSVWIPERYLNLPCRPPAKISARGQTRCVLSKRQYYRALCGTSKTMFKPAVWRSLDRQWRTASLQIWRSWIFTYGGVWKFLFLQLNRRR
jgi:hypothetical protein